MSRLLRRRFPQLLLIGRHAEVWPDSFGTGQVHPTFRLQLCLVCGPERINHRCYYGERGGAIADFRDATLQLRRGKVAGMAALHHGGALSVSQYGAGDRVSTLVESSAVVRRMVPVG